METISLLELGWPAWLTLGVVLGTFLILFLTRLPSDYVFFGGLAVLLLTGVLDARETLSGFSSPGLVTVGVLYIVVAGLKETGGLLWISQRVLGQPSSTGRAQFRLMSSVGFLSAFLNNTPIVALFIPIVMDWSRRIRVQPSRLLIPLSYASILGGTCTLVGTSTNLIVNGMVQTRYGGEGLGMFEIAKIGIPLAVVGVLFILLTPKLLPSRKAFDEIVANPREYTLELKVTEGGAIENKTIEAAGLRRLPGAFLAELIRGDHVYPAVPPDTVLQADDRLVFVGNVDSIKTLYEFKDLHPATDQIFKLDYPRHKRVMVEAVVSNTCPLLGNSIREGRFRQRYNAVVVAVARNGERIKGRIGDIILRPGDTLLVESHAGFISRQKDTRDFYLINQIDNFSPRRFDRAPIAFGILILMVASVAANWLSMLEASMCAAGLMLLTGASSPGNARRNIEWDVLLTIAAALGLGVALDKTGAAAAIASYLLNIVGTNPWLALAMVYVITCVFTAIITNNAAAALVFPLAMNTAEQLGVSIMPFIICVMLGASASFATPIGYQTNLMVYGPGGYRFSDYLRVGLPLTILTGGLAVWLAPIIWMF
jgi:di/tricarboxylate transporter